MGRKNIARKIEVGNYSFTSHAYDQMFKREIYIKQVSDVILNGRVIGKRSEKDGDALVIIGERFNGDPLKVVVKDCPIPKVITVCYPYEEI
ncbi:MAG: DUF4258 domain-containing protein [Candidatus Riflebacteria bacterium]|nr:DUF4258 domain-containing protein [Candidatus Riflebacteria bacterium]